ncbi:hypothetical protein [Rhodobium gokarnense]|uniref:Uncharacterized protein n=1 Tax=Rhodobium gokarnense TaxID=364296 RepID=A0ABT3HDV2_9HYPH|nr:hypothetical protein [Rhodobium gokarnense]MCW2308575.1 hypothetical protein [Rhodobium gokarnense]
METEAPVKCLRSEASHIADVLGHSDRYQYWVGASGKRYLFTTMPVAIISDFQTAVVLTTHPDDSRETSWIGTAAEFLAESASLGQPKRAYVHLLSPTRAARQAVIDDLHAALPN